MCPEWTLNAIRIAHDTAIRHPATRRRIPINPLPYCILISQNKSNFSIAIIGAGIAGLTAARLLAEAGFDVHLFDKARGPGGRMASRRTESLVFDHGAQYFTARDPFFTSEVRKWIERGVVEKWDGSIGTIGKTHSEAQSHTERFVGVPRMSALTRMLSEELPITFSTRITNAVKESNQWRLEAENGKAIDRTFTSLIINTPPEQALSFLGRSASLSRTVQQVTMLPCWAVMVSFAHALPVSHDGLFIHDAPLSWAARNNSKPGRGSIETWTLHGSPGWSRENLEADKDHVASRLLAAFFETVEIEPVSPTFAQAHRWRFALAENPLEAGCLWDRREQLGVCGDWCYGSRVEGAFLSGKAIAEQITAHRNP